MPAWRVALVSFGICAIIAGSGFDIITGREHWPFSPYAMFSSVETDTVTTRIYLYGMPAQPDREPFLLDDPSYTAPLGIIRLHTALQKMQREPDGETLLRKAARDCLSRYERLRQDDRHDGPSLRSLQVVRYTWLIDAQARNQDEPHREVLLEVYAADLTPTTP